MENFKIEDVENGNHKLMFSVEMINEQLAVIVDRIGNNFLGIRNKKKKINF